MSNPCQGDDKPIGISRRDALKRIALKGAVLATVPYLMSHLTAFAADDPEVIRYASLVDPNEVIPQYSDYASQYSSQYSSQSSYRDYAGSSYSGSGSGSSGSSYKPTYYNKSEEMLNRYNNTVYRPYGHSGTSYYFHGVLN